MRCFSLPRGDLRVSQPVSWSVGYILSISKLSKVTRYAVNTPFIIYTFHEKEIKLIYIYHKIQAESQQPVHISSPLITYQNSYNIIDQSKYFLSSL